MGIELPLRLREDEQLELVAGLEDAVVMVTTERLAVQLGARTVLEVEVEGVRRVELSVEHDVPATFSVVPYDPLRLPQVLTVPDSRLDDMLALLGTLGRRLRHTA